MTTTIIAAISENRVIGAAGRLPWHLPADIRRFKARTLGHPVIMGRKTWDTVGVPLPDRWNIVVSRSEVFRSEGATVVAGVEEALALAGGRSAEDEEIFIIGGGQIYELALQIVDRLDLTIVHAVVEGDTFFPAFDLGDWTLMGDERHEPDERHAFAFSFRTYERARRAPATAK